MSRERKESVLPSLLAECHPHFPGCPPAQPASVIGGFLEIYRHLHVDGTHRRVLFEGIARPFCSSEGLAIELGEVTGGERPPDADWPTLDFLLCFGVGEAEVVEL